MWRKENGNSKMDLAKSMIEEILPLLSTKWIIILCDSWYAKSSFLSIRKEHKDVDPKIPLILYTYKI